MEPTAILPFIGSWTPETLLAFVMFALIKGWLIPRATHDKVVVEKDKQIAIWEAVAVKYKASLELKDGVVPAQLESAKTTEQLILALRKLTQDPAEEKT